MIRILAYAPASQVFATVDAINDIGALAISPRKVVMVRDKRHCKYNAVDAPALEGYIFAAMSERDWFRVQTDLRHNGKRITLHRVADVSDNEWRLNVQPCVQMIETAYQAAMADYERQRHEGKPRPYVPPYGMGDALAFLGGELQGVMAEYAGYRDGLIMAEMNLMGQTVRVKVDPAKVRKWAAE